MIQKTSDDPYIIKVTILTYNIGPFGGIEKMILQVGKALQAAGCNVEGISVSSSSKNSIISNIPVSNIQPRNILIRSIYYRSLAYWFPLFLRTKTISSDLILVAHFHLLKYAVSVAKKSKKKLWLIAHGIEIWRAWTPQERTLIEACDLIIAVSKYTANSIIERLTESSERVVVIPNMVDIKQFRPPSFTIKDTPRVILTVSRLSSSEAYKGHDLIIHSLHRLEKRINIPVEYHIVGEGDDKARLIKIAKSCNVSEKVKFLGHLEGNAFLSEYQKCHVFAMPSYVSMRKDGSWTGEGFGIVYIEAAVCGKPVLACDNGGQVDCVVDKVTGRLVQPTSESVEDGLFEILGDLNKASKMGRSGRDFVLNNFAEEVVFRQWGKLIKNKYSINKCVE